MRRSTLRRLHGWIGLPCCLLLIAFCVSGIALNHREALADYDLSRRWLPEQYHYHNWDQGLMRGTLRGQLADYSSHGRKTTDQASGSDVVWIYGNAGIWRTDTRGHNVQSDSQGMPVGIDHRNVRAMIMLPTAEQWALTPTAIYRRPAPTAPWQAAVPAPADARWTDLTLRGDSLIALSRSGAQFSLPPYRNWTPLALPHAADEDGQVSLFRTLWLLHSGALFGTAGRWLMDAVALVLIALSLTGITLFCFPRLLQRMRPGDARRSVARGYASHLRWHNRLGRRTIVLTLLVVATGWALRPPLLLALVGIDVPRLPLTAVDTPNLWDDRLRMLRWDARAGEFLLSTSSGFYRFGEFGQVPQPVDAPPVSVMGLNVWERHAGGWLIGSFGGIYHWDRAAGRSTDWLTGLPAPSRLGNPFGRTAVAGFSRDFVGLDGRPLSLVVEHFGGTPLLPQPEAMRHLPISLWNAALELHNGRLYTFLVEPALFFIFLAGAMVLVVLYSGWRLRKAPS
ncbi:MAG: PepSY domain-containing protein [Bacteroidaceae bacterium]|nr:PepSY domain-containing protein [Bacteroidaceae bacterium]